MPANTYTEEELEAVRKNPKANFLVRDANGGGWWFEKEPVKEGLCWSAHNGGAYGVLRQANWENTARVTALKLNGRLDQLKEELAREIRSGKFTVEEVEWFIRTKCIKRKSLTNE